LVRKICSRTPVDHTHTQHSVQWCTSECEKAATVADSSGEAEADETRGSDGDRCRHDTSHTQHNTAAYRPVISHQQTAAKFRLRNVRES